MPTYGTKTNFTWEIYFKEIRFHAISFRFHGMSQSYVRCTTSSSNIKYTAVDHYCREQSFHAVFVNIRVYYFLVVSVNFLLVAEIRNRSNYLGRYNLARHTSATRSVSHSTLHFVYRANGACIFSGTLVYLAG